jgi:glycosyltransferase involved in cell wall biosynthesis
MIDLIALLDKSDPPEHSFVDGFLSSLLPAQEDFRVRLIVSRSATDRPRRPYRYERAVCVPALCQRRSLGRFANLFHAVRLLIPQLRKLRRRGDDVVLLVRNCPVLLFAAAVVSPLANRVVYQSSFPHERASGNPLMRWGARVLIRLSRGRVQGLLAVSPLGLDRVRSLFPDVEEAAAIPLVADVPPGIAAPRCPVTGTIRFIYAGSHEPRRGIDTMLRAAAVALDRGLDVEFRFVGCTDAQRQRITADDRVAAWLGRGRISVLAPVPRRDIWRQLAGCHIGLSLIPPRPEYREAFPTKLVEYLGVGLAVLGSRGIPVQEELLDSSQAGLLVAWQVEAIADGIERMVADREELAWCQVAARRYAASALTPRCHLATLLPVLLGSDACLPPHPAGIPSLGSRTGSFPGSSDDGDG